MNAVFAAVLLAVVATTSGTVVSGLNQYYVPSTYGSAVQYVQPSTYGYQYVQPQQYVSSSNIVSQSALPINYASSAAIVPSTYASGLSYGLNYPYTYNYGTYGYAGLLKK